MRTLIVNRPSWLAELAAGWIYWLLFLLLLEVGNFLAAAAPLPVLSEAGRILGASLLGAISAPPLLALVRRFPLDEPVLWQRLLIQAAGVTAVSVALLLIGVVLGTLAGIPQRPNLAAEFSANGGLMFYCVLSFVAGANGLQLFSSSRRAALPVANAYPGNLPVKDGHGLKIIDLATVDWIESQGNYIAVHQGGRHCLVRETLSAFEKKLDPALFRRIHRGAMVRLDRVREITPLANGDQALTLITGAELRVSRTYREGVQAAIADSEFDRKQRSAGVSRSD